MGWCKSLRGWTSNQPGLNRKGTRIPRAFLFKVNCAGAKRESINWSIFVANEHNIGSPISNDCQRGAFEVVTQSPCFYKA